MLETFTKMKCMILQGILMMCDKDTGIPGKICQIQQKLLDSEQLLQHAVIFILTLHM